MTNVARNAVSRGIGGSLMGSTGCMMGQGLYIPNISYDGRETKSVKKPGDAAALNKPKLKLQIS